MSIETYEKITGKVELYHLLDGGLATRDGGEVISSEKVFADLKKILKR